MSKHLSRTILIVLCTIVALYYVYPTVGWMVMSEETRQARIEKWQKEDDELARSRPSYFHKSMVRIKRWAECDRDMVINLGLDLQGGVHMVIGFDINDLPEEKLKDYRDRKYGDADIEQEIQQMVLNQVTTRVNDFEAKEPVIQTLGTNQIQIQLPGEKDVERAKKLITKTAQLNFHIVAGPDASKPVFGKIRDTFPEEFLPYVQISAMRGDTLTVTPDNLDRVRRVLAKAAEAGVIPEDKLVSFSQPPKAYEKQEYQLYVIDKKPIASGEGLTSAVAIPDQSNPPYWQILFEFNAAAGANFAEVTAANIGNPMAIVLDGVVVSAPVIRDRIAGRGQISGSFEGEEARDLAIALNSGSMVVPVREEFSRVVSASLGEDAVRKGVISSLFSVVVVAAFMVSYYFGAGFIAIIGLLFNGLLMIAAMAYFGLTLTLPGIAGFVLTIGMAVDANVLIYERMREELKLGHTLFASVENGFKNAASAILDSNITTLIAGAVLMQFGTGPIEGFAVTLSIGVCSTLFSAMIITPAIFDFVLEKKLVRSLRMLHLISMEPRIRFMELRKIVVTATLVSIAIGMGYFGFRGMDNFGVDFQQGTNLMLTIAQNEPVPVEKVRNALGDAGFESPVVQETENTDGAVSNQFIIRVGDVTREKVEGADPNVMVTVADRIRTALLPLASANAADSIVIEDEQTVGPSVGAQLRWDAFLALFWSMVFVVIYLWFRFELRFSVGAVAATLHDILFTVGLFSILGREISMPVIAALLTIVGYSLNDTIVVFDRVREELQLNRGKGIKLLDILNLAINRTLSRTILTGMTTLFVTVVLMIFGGDSLFDFALVITIGIFVGTYSSIFIASPVVYYFEGWNKKKAAAAAAAQGGSRRAAQKAEPKTV